MTDWFLHSKEENSFYFRRTDMPDTDMEGFTLTYIKPGYVVLTGDMGCLTWQRNESGFDYGFPNKNTGIEYFAEKVCRAEHQQTRIWDVDIALADVTNYFADEIKENDCSKTRERFEKMKFMLEDSNWGDCPRVVGQFRMYEDLEDCFPDEDWSESEFGEIWEYHLKRKFEMVKSVSELVLEAARA
jgi:hypothetical protein